MSDPARSQRLRLAVCGLILTLLAGCGTMATGPNVGQTPVAMAPVPSDRGRLFIYRPNNFTGSALTPSLFADNVKLADLPLEGAFYCDFAPGNHLVWATETEFGNNVAPLTINVPAGQAVYLRFEPWVSLFTGGFRLVMPPEAPTEVQSMHLTSAQCPHVASLGAATFPKDAVAQAIDQGDAAKAQRDASGAMAIYVAALEKYPERITTAPDLVNRAVDMALTMTPVPVVQEAARKHAIAASSEIRSAKSKGDFAKARTEYLQALAAAPWWADAWFNLAMLDEQIGNYSEAKFCLDSYLRAAPSAPDRDTIEQKIKDLQAKSGRS